MREFKKPEEIIDPYSKEKITEWKTIIIKKTDMILYYKPLSEEEKQGFNFYCIEACAWDTETEKILKCYCIYHGIAYWDGIRHFYVGDHQTDNYGYLYYLLINAFLFALKELKKLEKKYCKFDY